MNILFKKIICLFLIFFIADAKVTTFLVIGDSVSKLGPRPSMTTLVAGKPYLSMISSTTNNGEFMGTILNYNNVLGQYWGTIDYVVINFGIHEIYDGDSDSLYKWELCWLADSAKKYHKPVIWNQTTSLRDSNGRVIDFNIMAENVLDSILGDGRYRIVHQYDFQKADSLSYLWDTDGIHYANSVTAYPLFAQHTIASIDSQIVYDSINPWYDSINNIHYPTYIKNFYVGIADSIKPIFAGYPDSIKIRGTALPSGITLGATTGVIKWSGSGSLQSNISYTVAEFKNSGADSTKTDVTLSILPTPSPGDRKITTCNCVY